MHNVTYEHSVAYYRQNQETQSGPSLSLGKLEADLDDVDKVVLFLEEAKELLQLHFVELYDLWKFLSGYFKPEGTNDYIDCKMREKFGKVEKRVFPGFPIVQ